MRIKFEIVRIIKVTNVSAKMGDTNVVIKIPALYTLKGLPQLAGHAS